AEDDVSGGKCFAQRAHQPAGIIARIASPRELQAARIKQLDELGEMFVGTPAGQYFIANDERAERHVRPQLPAAGGGGGGSRMTTPLASRSRASAPSMKCTKASALKAGAMRFTKGTCANSAQAPPSSSMRSRR